MREFKFFFFKREVGNVRWLCMNCVISVMALRRGPLIELSSFAQGKQTNLHCMTF